MQLRKSLTKAVLALLALLLSQSITLGQAAQAKTQRFGTGWLEMPAGYKFEHVNGPDFGVDYMIPKDADLQGTTTMFGLYMGNAPSFEPPKGVKILAGHFGARKLNWHIWKTVADNETVYHRQALIKFKNGFWHLFLSAPDMQRMRELMSILDSYRAKA